MKTQLSTNRHHRMRAYGALFLLSLLGLFACKKEENMPPPAPKEGNIMARMGDNMIAGEKSFYVDLSTGTVTETSVSSWDLAFESKGQHILINTGKRARLLNTGQSDFAQVTSQQANSYGANKAYQLEQIDGDMTQTAVGDWANADATSKREIYVLNLGTDVNRKELGYKKWMVLNYEEGKSFEIKYADLTGQNEKTMKIALSSKHNFTYFSLTDHQVVDVEPERGQWDFVLTPVTTILDLKIPNVPPAEYLFSVAQSNSYEDIGIAVNDPLSKEPPANRARAANGAHKGNYATLNKAHYTSASTKANTMGVSTQGAPHWWYYDERGNQYYVYSFISYILKDAEGHYFKLRYTSVTDPETGKNGTPQLEYKVLE